MAGCGDTLSLADLQTAKKHQTFEAEVITGLQGGIAGGKAIDYATNQVTGQTQKTMPAILRDLGFQPASFDFSTGGTLSGADRDKAVLWPLSAGGDGAYYSWQGALPKVIPASSTPASTGGVVAGAWAQLGDITLRQELFTTKKYIPWTTPLAGWASLKECFESDYETILVPAGTYTLTDTLTANLTGNKRIVCEPGVVFRLADNVRKPMLHFFGNDTNTFEFSGWEIDGNFEGQGPETMTNGAIDNVSGGVTVSRFKSAHLHDFYAHDCMGHHVNHGGNKNFIAERFSIRAHPSALKPLGGARGDGITGVSENVIIRDGRGFSTDDFIAVVAGIQWIDGYNGLMDIKSVLIENIHCETYNYQGTDRYSWTGVSVGVCNGRVTESVVISNVTGDTLSRGVGVTASAYNDAYWGSFRTIRIKGISLCVHGDPANGFTAKMNTAHVVIGNVWPNGVSSTKNNFAWEVSVSDVQCRGSVYSMGGVFIGHMDIRQLIIENVQCVYDDASQITRAVIIAGQKDIQQVSISNIQQQGNAALSDSDRAGRCAIESYYGGAIVTDLHMSGFSSLLNNAGTAYVPNVSFVQATGQVKTIPRLFGDRTVVCNLDGSGTGGVRAVPKAHGTAFCTPNLGYITYSRFTTLWTFHDFAVAWDSTNFGLPNASNFPNFALFDWQPGTLVPVKGSPLHECRGYVALSATPTFDLQSYSTFTSSPVLQSSGWTPQTTPLTPGSTIITDIPEGSTDAGFPQTGAGILETHVSTYSNRVQTRQIWQRSGTRFDRYWTGTSWSDFTAF